MRPYLRFAVLCFVALNLTLGPSLAAADSGCSKVETEGTIVQDLFTNTAGGEMDIVIGDWVGTAFTTIEIIWIKFTDDGTQVTLWGVTWDLGNGDTFYAEMHGVLSPVVPGVEYRVNGQGKVIDGTGVFEDTLGKMVFHGSFEIAFPYGYADLTGKGKLCSVVID